MKVLRLIFIPILVICVLGAVGFVAATRVFDRAVSAQQAVIPVTAPDEMFQGCAGPWVQPINPDFEQDIVERTNQIRAEHNLPPLKRVAGLDLSARYHTADMSVNNFFDHNTVHVVDGRSVEICDTWARIEKYYFNWTALAENIAAGQSVPEMAIDGWMNSPDHRHNMLSDSYWEIGVGYYEGKGDYHYYWGQNFGKRQGIYPLVIELDKARTEKREVEVYLYGEWDEMRIRTDQSEWSAWMPFRNSFKWHLPDSPGVYMISAEMRGPDGEASSSDQIERVAPNLCP